MPIKKGNTTIGAIYKGTTQISAIYKGTVLVYSAEHFISEIFSNLYYDYTDGTKAKLIKYEGNTVVENQLVQNGNFEDSSGWTNAGGSFTISNGKATFTQTATGDRFKQLNITTIANHKYLIVGTVKSDTSGSVTLEISRSWAATSKSLSANVLTTISGIIIPTAASDSYNMFQVYGSGACVLEIYEVMLIDLTLMFGTGNEPTTLTDKRIQSLLNRGYIPYNTGTLKSSVLGELVSYDTNSDYLGKIALPKPLQLNGALNTHDSFEVSKTEYKITRKTGILDLSVPLWSASGATGNASTAYLMDLAKKPSSNNDIPNFVSNWGIAMSYNAAWGSENVVSMNTSGALYVKLPNNPNETAEQVKAHLTGYTLYYELASAQTLTIPKKHLGCIDLSTLSDSNTGWHYSSTDQCFFVKIEDLETTITKPVYIADYPFEIMTTLSSLKDHCCTRSNSWLYIKDTRYTLVADFLKAMSGKVMYYHSTTEQTDFTNKMTCEVGGSITGKEFEWKENEMLINNDFASNSGWSVTNGTLSISDGVGTITKSSSSASVLTQTLPPLAIYDTYYLCIATVESSASTTCVFNVANKSASHSISANTKTRVYSILKPTSGVVTNVNLTVGASMSSGTIKVSEFSVIDLSQGFTEDIPISTDDWRIQYILNQGIVPYNSSGTTKQIDTEVLPNVEIGMVK